jgi:hypothetical protein
MPPKTPAPLDSAPAEAAAPAAAGDDADRTADFAPVNLELPDIQSKFATLYTNLEKEQRARCELVYSLTRLRAVRYRRLPANAAAAGASSMKSVFWTCENM